MKNLLLLVFILIGLPGIAQQNQVLEKLFTQPFPHALTSEAFKNHLGMFVSFRHNPVANHHYPSVTDTLVKINYFKSSIKLYKAGEKTLIDEFHIANRRIKLLEGIHKGMKREELTQILPQLESIREDTVKFADQDNTVYIEFVFNRRDKLKSINYKSAIF